MASKIPSSAVLIVLSAFLLPATAAHAGMFPWRKACEADKDPEIVVRAAPPDYVMDRTLDSRGLGALFAKRNGRAGFFDRYVSGLTDGNLGSTVSYRTEAWRSASGEWCASLSGMEVDVAFAGPVRIYVDGDLPEASCAYRAVYRHEMRHYEIFRGFLKQGQPRLAAALRSLVGSSPPLGRGIDEETARSLVIRSGQDVVDKAVADLMRHADAESAAIDTPQEYARVQASCDDWIH